MSTNTRKCLQYKISRKFARKIARFSLPICNRANGYYAVSSRFLKTCAHAPKSLRILSTENVYKHITIFAVVIFICVNWLVFVIKMQWVYCKVSTELSNTIETTEINYKLSEYS